MYRGERGYLFRFFNFSLREDYIMTYESERFDTVNKRLKCTACGCFTWGYELDESGRCAAKGCQAPVEAKQTENKAPVIQLVPREKTSSGSEKEQLAA